jgi:excisionase family DNA binding protein
MRGVSTNKPQCSGRLLRIQEAAERLRLQPSTIRKMVMQRRIDVVRPTARALRISEITIEAILAKGYRLAISA